MSEYRTKSGRVLTDADIEAFAEEAERGYNVDHLRVVIRPGSPIDRTERAAEDRAIRFLLDGLGVESIRELKRLVDAGRVTEAWEDR